MNWTPEQSAAIADEGGTLLISAAAGSGKTAVLVERAARLMLKSENPVPADKILIVTFTRAAADELRARIGLRLSEEQALYPQNINIRRQRLLLGRASICTIDAFCMQLLKQHFTELSLPPDFDKADDSLISALRFEAAREMLEEMYSDTAFCALASMYGRSRTDDNIKDAVLRVYDFLRSAALPEKMAADIENMWVMPMPLAQTAWGAELFLQAGLLAQSAFDIALTAKSFALEKGLEHYAPALEADIAALELIKKRIDEKQWDEAYTSVQAYKAVPLRGKKGFEGDEADTVKLLRDKVKKTIAKLSEGVFICTEAEFYEDIALASPMVSSLMRAAKRFEEIFYAKKINEKVLEYSDFEHLARKLLCTESGEKTEAAKALSAQFDAVMIDEYQDTNALQALLYSCLANDNGSNLFMVGDVKQSIYRFRLAEPGIFVAKKDSYMPYGSGYPSVITLGHNFRSAESVVDQINYIFSKAMSRGLGGVDYTEGERLKAGGGAGVQGEAAELIIADTNGGRSEAADADAVAEKISEMMKSGFAVREGQGTRPCRYGDFCILLRTRAPMLQYTAALEAKGIPCTADTSESTLLSPEISPLLSLLRIIDNPGQDIHMAAVLLSPMYGLEPDALLRLREKGKTLYAALIASTGQAEQAVTADLRYFRAVAASAPLTELIDAVMSRTNYFSAVSAMPEGAIRREGLRAFISYACDACAAMGGLSAFLRRLDAQDKAPAELETAAKASQGAVSIMTVHKSKGLEFPVCILANVQHSFNTSSYQSNLMLHPALGLGLSLRAQEGSLYATLPQRALSLAERRECVSEEMRVLYVALTRARDKLIITMAKKDTAGFLESAVVPLLCGKAAQNSFLQSATDASAWVCAALLTHPGCEDLRRVKAGALLKVDSNEKSRFTAKIISAQENCENKAQQTERTAMPSAELLSALENSFNASKAIKLRERVPVKQSVSALAKPASRESLSRPSFAYSGGLTAAEKGTAMHSFLQFANFDAAQKSLEAEQERLCREGYVLPEIMQRLDKAAITAFLNSEVVSRVSVAERVYKEYDFITQAESEEKTEGNFLVQGIADLVIISDNSIEIADYKTDKGKTAQELINSYSRQLYLYATAISRRFGLPVVRLTIYSFSLLCEIDVPLG